MSKYTIHCYNFLFHIFNKIDYLDNIIRPLQSRYRKKENFESFFSKITNKGKRIINDAVFSAASKRDFESIRTYEFYEN